MATSRHTLEGMRAIAGLALVLVLPSVASADDSVNAMVAPAADPAAAPPPEPAPPPTAPPPDYQPYSQPSPTTGPRVKSWFATVGLGGMGYVGRPVEQFDDSDSGPALELVIGKWFSSQEVAIGGRIEAHTDDAERYTDSSLTLIARFGLGESKRFYLEPGLGLAFHKQENSDETETGFAVAMTAGYALLKNRFALDLRGGVAHYRQERDQFEHGQIWLGVAIGIQ